MTVREQVGELKPSRTLCPRLPACVRVLCLSVCGTWLAGWLVGGYS
jgi:hypothetical protein